MPGGRPATEQYQKNQRLIASALKQHCMVDGILLILHLVQGDQIRPYTPQAAAVGASGRFGIHAVSL